jgi:peptidoglycan/LPS O-acetylase OafA/YrhL
MGRNGTFDHARLLAAFGIVVFHTGAPGAAIGYAGLPFFLILLVLLAFPAAQCMSFTDFAALRARRLLRPWLIWSAVYAALKLAEIAVTGTPLRAEFTASMILTGPALHLWFLPFAFAASLWVYGLARLRQVLPVPVQALCAVLLLAALALLSLHQRGGLPVPVAQWVFAGPAVCLGSIFALLGTWTMQKAPAVALVVAGLVGAAMLLSGPGGVLQITIAGTVFALCTAYPRPATPVSRWAAEAAMGVYLVHPLVLSLADRAGIAQPGTVPMALAGIAGSLALIAGWQAALRYAPLPPGGWVNTQRP